MLFLQENIEIRMAFLYPCPITTTTTTPG